MKRGRGLVAAIATGLLALASARGAENGGGTDEAPLQAGRGALTVSVQCGADGRQPAPQREEHGVWRCQWRATPDCAAELQVARSRRPVGLGECEFLALRLVVTNQSAEPNRVPVVVRLQPTERAAPAVRSLSFERHAFFLEGRPILVAEAPSSGAILADSALGPRPFSPEQTAHVSSASGECRGEMIFDLTLAPGETRTLGFVAPSPAADSPEVPVTLEFVRGRATEEFFPATVPPPTRTNRR